jgi:hypothetical protein
MDMLFSIPPFFYPSGQVPVGQLESELLDFPLLPVTLNVPMVFLMFLLLHFLHFLSSVWEVTPTSKSNFSPQSLQTYV